MNRELIYSGAACAHAARYRASTRNNALLSQLAHTDSLLTTNYFNSNCTNIFVAETLISFLFNALSHFNNMFIVIVMK